jgi:ethanolamine ammonia-lyase small subunit
VNRAVTPQPWGALRAHTAARIALGRAGASQPTAAHLAFQQAHAAARDAVHAAMDWGALEAGLRQLGAAPLRVHSAAADRACYLRRPDLGRRLDEASRHQLAAQLAPATDLAFVFADGLSALALQRQALPLFAALRQRLREEGGWTWAPPVLAAQARVALGDEVGALLGARCVVVFIGERPGLSAPDSLGVYFSWAPRVGLLDAQRNCLSNVRPEGLPPEAAARKLHTLLAQARARQLTGVDLKDEDDALAPPTAGSAPATPATPATVQRLLAGD